MKYNDNIKPQSLSELLGESEEKISDEYLGFYKTPRSQAERVLWKFGGVRKFCRALDELGVHLEVSGVYKWLYSREKGGTNGRIPTKAWPLILSAAKHCGLIITKDDMDFRSFPFPKPRVYQEQRGIYGVVERKGKEYGADVDLRSKYVIEKTKAMREKYKKIAQQNKQKKKAKNENRS